VGLFLHFLIIFICELSMLFFSFFLKIILWSTFMKFLRGIFFIGVKRLVVLLQVIPDGYMFFSYPYYSCEYGIIYTQLFFSFFLVVCVWLITICLVYFIFFNYKSENFTHPFRVFFRKNIRIKYLSALVFFKSSKK
jgi:hypothetical protein